MFWRVVRRGGERAAGLGLRLYYVLEAPGTPRGAKALAAAAVAYFVLPLDAVADALPLVGFGDDVAVMTAALRAIAAHVTPEIAARADAKVREWFAGRGPTRG